AEEGLEVAPERLVDTGQGHVELVADQRFELDDRLAERRLGVLQVLHLTGQKVIALAVLAIIERRLSIDRTERPDLFAQGGDPTLELGNVEASPGHRRQPPPGGVWLAQPVGQGRDRLAGRYNLP